MQVEITPNVSPDASESKTVPVVEEAAEGRPRKKARVPKIRPVFPVKPYKTAAPTPLSIDYFVQLEPSVKYGIAIGGIICILLLAVREKSEVVT